MDSGTGSSTVIRVVPSDLAWRVISDPLVDRMIDRLCTRERAIEHALELAAELMRTSRRVRVRVEDAMGGTAEELDLERPSLAA